MIKEISRRDFLKIGLGSAAAFLLLSACTTEDNQNNPTSENSVLAEFEHASGQTTLAEGLALHEKGLYEDALDIFDLAYQKFEEEGNTEKMAEALAAKSLPLRRLNRHQEAVTFLGQAIELTKGTGGVVLPLYELSKVQEEMGNPVCIKTYKQTLEAMEKYRPSPHYRPAVINDMKLHLALAQLAFDRDSGNAEQRALRAISKLQADEELDPFGKMVWVSGGYLGLAGYYIETDAQKAWQYFDQAEEVIFAYPDDTILRRQDLEALREQMPPRS